MTPEEIAVARKQLNDMYPQPTVVKFGALEWAIVPMGMDRIAAVLGHTLPAMPAVVEATKTTKEGDELAFELIPVFIEFAGSHPKEFFAALSIAIDKPVELLQMLPPGVMPGLLAAVYKANEAFFLASLVDLASESKATASNGAGAMAGQTHSTSSLAAGMSTQ